MPSSRGGGPGSHGGMRRKSEGAPGGCKGEGQSGPLTHPSPPILESSQGPFVPNTPSEPSQSSLLSDLQLPHCRGQAHPTAQETPYQPVGAEQWVPGRTGQAGHRLGMKAGLGLRGLPSWSFSHTQCLSSVSQRLAFSLSTSLALCLSQYFLLPVSPRLCPRFSVLQHLEHVATKRRKVGFPPAWRLPSSLWDRITNNFWGPERVGGRVRDWTACGGAWRWAGMG